jgi:hypothetical protein
MPFTSTQESLVRFAEVNLFGVYVAPISGIMVAANVLCTNRTIISVASPCA